MLFHNRQDAGKQLAQHLKTYRNQPDVLVLGLPRGGVPVAYEVARELNAPLDVFLVRKLGVPKQPELAMGAIASGGVRILNQMLIDSLDISKREIEAVAEAEQLELARREQLYRPNLPPLDVQNRTVIVVDDGLATGATMHVAAVALRRQKPRKLIAAVPVSSPQICDPFQLEVDEAICAETPQPFYSVGLWYDKFEQTTDAEVRDLLNRANNQQLSQTNS